MTTITVVTKRQFLDFFGVSCPDDSLPSASKPYARSWFLWLDLRLLTRTAQLAIWVRTHCLQGFIADCARAAKGILFSLLS
jgi:hypothetical protein